MGWYDDSVLYIVDRENATIPVCFTEGSSARLHAGDKKYVGRTPQHYCRYVAETVPMYTVGAFPVRLPTNPPAAKIHVSQASVPDVSAYTQQEGDGG